MKQTITMTTLAALLLLASFPVAAESRIVHASNCLPSSNNFRFDNIANSITPKQSANFVNVLCPIVRHNTSNAPIPTLEIRIKRNSQATENMSCRVASFNQWQDRIYVSSKFGTRRAGSSDRQVLKFNNIPTRWKGPVYASCYVPRGWALINVFWNE